MQSESCLQNHNHKSNCFTLLHPRSVPGYGTCEVSPTAHIRRSAPKAFFSAFQGIFAISQMWKSCPEPTLNFLLLHGKKHPPASALDRVFPRAVWSSLFGPRKLVIRPQQGPLGPRVPSHELKLHWNATTSLNAPEISLLHWTTSTTEEKQTSNLTQHHTKRRHFSLPAAETNKTLLNTQTS